MFFEEDNFVLFKQTKIHILFPVYFSQCLCQKQRLVPSKVDRPSPSSFGEAHCCFLVVGIGW